MASTRWLLVMFLWTLLVTGSACSRRRLETVQDFWSCCTSVEECLASLQEAKAPGPGSSMPWFRPAPETRCAAFILAEGRVGERSEIIPRVVALLSHPEPRVRDAAAYTLLQARGRGARDAVPALIEAHEKDPRGGALAALVGLDDARAAPLLRRYLQGGASEPLTALPCIDDTLAPVLLEELENPESPLWARKQGLPSLCALPRELAPRFRELLRRELAEPSLRRPSDASCREPAPRSCQLVFDGCLPHAASLIGLLSRLSGEELSSDLVAALAREDERLKPFALRALVGLRSPEAFPHLFRQLSSPQRDCRLDALEDLTSLERLLDKVPPETLEVLLGLLERGSPPERANAALVLRALRDPRAIEPLRRALKAPQPQVQWSAAKALGGFGAEAKAAVPELAELARTDASQDVRWAAAEARYEISEQWEPAATPRCPRVVPYLDGWALRRRSGLLPLRSVSRSAPLQLPPPSSPCASLYADSFGDIFFPMGGACLFAGFKYGVREKGRTTLFHGERWADDYSFVDEPLDFHGMVMVLQGVSSVGPQWGWLERVTRTPEGAWMRESFAPLPGEPVAYAFDESGALVIATTSQTRDAGDEYVHLRLDPEQRAQRPYGSKLVPPFKLSCREHVESRIVYAVRVTPDGQVAPVE